MDYRSDLLARYGARMFVSDLATEFGIARKTVLNQVSDGRFPVRTYRVGIQRCADTVEVATHFEAMAAKGVEAAKAPPSKDSRARRAQVERARAGNRPQS